MAAHREDQVRDACCRATLSYGIDQLDSLRRAATYVDRMLKGEKPSELPIQARQKTC
jgi:ABC-type uncharacterized transport system substrate-binding protein